ncbi:MAG: PAAR domain-containing protein [Armatimonadota bacterium]|nr:PAAR domain-containing protein [bacterium]
MASHIARLGDASDHGGVIISAASRTFINGKAAARKGDLHSCPRHGVTAIVSGSDTIIIEGQPAARVGDKTACGAVITSGSLDTSAG